MATSCIRNKYSMSSHVMSWNDLANANVVVAPQEGGEMYL